MALHTREGVLTDVQPPDAATNHRAGLADELNRVRWSTDFDPLLTSPGLHTSSHRPVSIHREDTSRTLVPKLKTIQLTGLG